MDLNKKPETSINIPTQDNDIEILGPKKKVEAHDGEQISLVFVSPNGTYVVTYSRKDLSIKGWIVDGVSTTVEDSKWIPLKPDPKVTVYKLDKVITEIKVNDNKIVLCGGLSKIIQMSGNHHLIELKLDGYNVETYDFNKNGDLVINTKNVYDLRQIFVYSLQNSEPILISSYYLSCDNIYTIKRINYGISDNILWTISPNYLSQWKLEPLQLEFSYSLGFNMEINEVKIGEVLTMVKSGKGIEIYSKGVHFPIQYIQTEYYITKIELLCESLYRYLLVTMEVEEKQNIRLYDVTDDKRFVDAMKIFKVDESDNIFLYEYNIESKKAFGLVNGRISSMNLSNWNCHEFFKSNHVDEKNEAVIGWNAYLNENYYESKDDVDADMENIIKIFSTKNIDQDSNIVFNNKQYKWSISQSQHKLLVYDINDVELLDSKDLLSFPLSKWNILNNNALVLLYYRYITIYKYDINNKKIKIQYYYSNYSNYGKILTAEEFSGSKLPINIDQGDVNYNIFDEWIENLIDDNKYLAKYGQNLLPILIKKKLIGHIESIYSKCIKKIQKEI